MSGLGDVTGELSRYPALDHVLSYFEYGHLPEPMRSISKRFADLARRTANQNPGSPETTVALRKLLEAKDAAVRAGILSSSADKSNWDF